MKSFPIVLALTAFATALEISSDYNDHSKGLILAEVEAEIAVEVECSGNCGCQNNCHHGCGHHCGNNNCCCSSDSSSSSSSDECPTLREAGCPVPLFSWCKCLNLNDFYSYNSVISAVNEFSPFEHKGCLNICELECLWTCSLEPFGASAALTIDEIFEEYDRDDSCCLKQMELVGVVGSLDLDLPDGPPDGPPDTEGRGGDERISDDRIPTPVDTTKL